MVRSAKLSKRPHIDNYRVDSGKLRVHASLNEKIPNPQLFQERNTEDVYFPNNF